MSLPNLLLALALAPQGPGQAPFALDLPPGYTTFVPAPNESGESFESLAAAGEDAGRFAVHSWLLAAPGARAELVAAHQRASFWTGQLRGVAHEMDAWEGPWSGRPAAGTIIAYTRERARRTAFERVLVIDDRLVIATWEGPQADAAEATTALDSFVLPAAWIPPPPPESDVERGLGPTARLLPSPGRMDVLFDYGDAALESFTVEIVFAPGPDLPWAESEVFWRPPPFARIVDGAEALADGRWRTPRGEDGGVRLRYELPLERSEETVAGLAEAAARHGLMVAYSRLAALDPLWLAAPEYPGELAQASGVPTPPAWALEILMPAHFSAFSWTPATESGILASGVKRVRFPELAAGRAWPFFLAGAYRGETYAGRVAQLAVGARAHKQGEVVRFLDAMSAALADWLPPADQGTAPATAWRLATFDGVFDRALPGLLVLDDLQGWLVSPLDGPWMGATRRAGLAQRISARAFGMQLRGAGNGAVFLEPALAEYGAWRLLQATGHAADADALLASWRQGETLAGPLPRPLTLMPPADLTMGRRLLTRGALVWLAIEQRAGRAALDAVLRKALAVGGTWTTEVLREALEDETGSKWSDFFAAHVYGRREPETSSGR
ncbi:MAG TPA: hypothetical protein VGC54_03780 [Planctomycetota bacterium]